MQIINKEDVTNAHSKHYVMNRNRNTSDGG